MGEWKSERIENILIFLIFVWLEVKMLRNKKKVNLYKFTHTPLLKNDGQLKQKSDKQPKNKNHLFFFIQYINSTLT